MGGGGGLTLLTSTEVFQDLILLHRCLARAAVRSNIQRQRILCHSSRRIQPSDTRFYATAAVRSNIRQTNDSMPQQPRHPTSNSNDFLTLQQPYDRASNDRNLPGFLDKHRGRPWRKNRRSRSPVHTDRSSKKGKTL